MQIVKTVKGRYHCMFFNWQSGHWGRPTDLTKHEHREQLKAWYQALFEQKSEEIFAKLDEEIENKRAEAIEDFNAIADEATEEIEETRAKGQNCFIEHRTSQVTASSKSR